MKLVGIVSVILILASTAAGAPSLSGLDRQRLVAGEVLVFDVLPPGGDVKGSQGGTAMALVRAPADVVWRVLVDYRRHSGLYPRVTETSVLEESARRTLVRYVIGVGPFSFGFHVANQADRTHGRVDWWLARDRDNDLFEDSWGYWQIDPDTDGVVLTYAMAARTVLPAFLTRGAERNGLVETVRAVRQRAERG